MNKIKNSLSSLIPSIVTIIIFLILPSIIFSAEIPTLETHAHYDSLQRLCLRKSVRTDINLESNF